MGDELVEGINDKLQSSDKQASDAYEETKRNSVNNSGKNNAPSLGTNPNSLFAGSGKSVNQRQKTQNTKTTKTNWLTANPDDLLDDSDDASLQDSDFKFKNTTSNTSNSKLPRTSELGFWKSSEGKETENPYIEASHIGLGTGAMGAGIGEFSYVRNGMWLGNNGKMYSMSWTGNRWTGGRNAVIETSELYHFAGKAFFVADTAIDAYQIIQDIKSNNITPVGPIEFDITMGAIGVFGGPVGFGISTAYFGVKEIIANWDTIETAFVQESEMDELNEKITGSNIWNRPRF